MFTNPAVDAQQPVGDTIHSIVAMARHGSIMLSATGILGSHEVQAPSVPGATTAWFTRRDGWQRVDRR
jgi:hypothetical protein